MVRDVPAFWNWQAAGRRLVGDKAAVLFSEKGLGGGVWGTAFFYRGYKFIQIRPNLPRKDQIRTLIHESLHFINDTPPTFRIVKGKLRLTGLKANWSEPQTYRQEAEIMAELEKRWAQLPPVRSELFPVAPVLIGRHIAAMIDCVY